MVHIELYRGFDISLNTESGAFVAIGSAYDTQSTHSSLNAARRAVDDFIKANVIFEPFDIYKTGGYGGNGMWQAHRVVGIRKDGAFVLEKDGNRWQLSSYDEKEFSITPPDPAKVEQIAQLTQRIGELQDQRRAIEGELNDAGGQWAKDARGKYAELINK
ncbi:MAG: hypothetical protein E6Q97_08835 [Desulfurellales bacterium]|nr:MAG: hypothetical protein E6Q97_08835 [Desulfurellales bacterium]